MVCRYLDHDPRLITPKLMEEINCAKLLPDASVYAALLASFCGLDPQAQERDREFVNAYFRPSVKHLDIETYRENPYYRNIRIPEAKFGNWELKLEEYAPFEAFLCKDLVNGEDHREFPLIGFFHDAFRFPCVMENRHEWMAVKPSEVETIRPALEEIQGDVVTFGLGLGYFAYMASRKENVSRITVVERDRDVISLFEHHILPQFERPDKVEIIHAEALEFTRREMPSRRFDYAFADLWHDVSDGLPLYLRLKQLEPGNPRTRFLYWIEDSLLSSLRWRLFDRIVQDARSYGEIERRLGRAFLDEVAPTGD